MTTDPADKARLDWLEQHWYRHGTRCHYPALSYTIWPADWEVENEKDKEPLAKGESLRAAIDAARAQEDQRGR